MRLKPRKAVLRKLARVGVMSALAVCGWLTPAAASAQDDIRVRFYGFAQADYIQDFGRVDPDWEDTLRPSRIPTTDGAFGDDGDRGACPAVFGEAGDGGFQEALTGDAAAVLLGAALHDRPCFRHAHNTHPGSRLSRNAVMPSRASAEANSRDERLVSSLASASKFSSTLAVSRRFVSARAVGAALRSPSRTGSSRSSTSAPAMVSTPTRAASAESNLSPVR